MPSSVGFWFGFGSYPEFPIFDNVLVGNCPVMIWIRLHLLVWRAIVTGQARTSPVPQDQPPQLLSLSQLTCR